MKSVLIVDDEVGLRSIYADIFRNEMGFEKIAFAGDGMEALTECAHQKFDVTSLDHQMPNMKGAEFLSLLRNNQGINQHTTVIMISAYLPELPETIMSIENTYFMDKPADLTRLVRYVNMSVKK